ncbi:MAG: heparinase II/III family protein [Pseudomonadota bacterium]
MAVVQAVNQDISRRSNRFVARTSVLAPRAKAFVSQPTPRAVGSAARARQLEAGNLHFAGELVEAPRKLIWDTASPSDAFEREIHTFSWLDDLAAAGDAPARRLAQAWVLSWIYRYGRGSGPGWQPDLTGRRLIRWLSHAPLILKGQDSKASHDIFRSLGRQTRYLSRRWRAAPVGQPRFAALTGLVYAALSLEGYDRLLNTAIGALGRDCARRIDDLGGIETRNPEELMEVFTLLVWSARALEEADHAPDPRHLAAIARIAPTLRTLRLGDGSLARFHGGGRGWEGQLDQALAEAGERATRQDEAAMGFARLHSGRTTLILDAATPPSGGASGEGHASTLGFELSSGRQPVIVSCGPGRLFGSEWRRACRATAAHSTGQFGRISSSRLAPSGFVARQLGTRLVSVPTEVSVQRATDLNGTWLLAAHNGYVSTHGVVHRRRIFLSPDGRDVRGEDTFVADTDAGRRQLEFALEKAGADAQMVALHFHIHPEVTASLDLAGSAVSLNLPNGEVWVFRQSAGEMTLGNSAYLDQQRLKPRATRQIIVHGRMDGQSTQITWALNRVQEARRDAWRSDEETGDPVPA